MPFWKATNCREVDRLDRTQVEVVSRLHQLQEQGIHVRTLDGLVNTKGLGKLPLYLLVCFLVWRRLNAR